MEKLTIFNDKTLIPVADKYQLTDQQREVFFRRLIEKKNYRQIAEELETSENACQKCMGEVYKKFNITGETRGKERRLIQVINSIITPQKSVSSIIYPSPFIERNFQFILRGEHAIARSLFAFIARTLKQVQVEHYSPAQIIGQAIREIVSDSSHRNILEKAPSATLRKFCLEQILKHLNSQRREKESSLNKLIISEESLINNMKIIRYVLDKLIKESCPKDHQLLEHIYEKGLSYQQIAGDWIDSPEKSENQDLINELKEKHEKLLKHIRLEFHTIKESENLEDYLKEVKETEIISYKNPEIKTKIELYSKIANLETLNNDNIQYLKLILDDSIRTPLIDFWINEIDHFIAHEREDLQYLETHKEFEAQQKIELINELKDGLLVNGKEKEPVLTIGIWEVKNFRLYCEQYQLAEAEVTLWNPKTNKQFTGIAVEKGSINALCQALNYSLNKALQLENKACNFFLYWVSLQNEKINNDINVPVTATVIIQDGSNFYVGKDINEDTITAAFNACVSATDNLVNNKSTCVEKIANEYTRTGIVKISGQARIEKTIEILTKIFETRESAPISIFAVSSGKLVSWWNSELGYKFQEFNKKLIQQGINIQRVFILDKLSSEIKEIMERQKRDGIDVRYILEENVENLQSNSEPFLGWQSLASTNFLVCGDELTTKMVVNSQGNEEDGSISFVQDDILVNKQQFDLIWEKAEDKDLVNSQ
ncbi:MAG: hypothetical protein IM550_16105 [Microcystis sp. M54BS1]|uniref:2-isopropylmalate synthase LeuA allosteric (dimerisation) domain-containing protein n=1 Tax=Microcystis flos-aquae FACHB-1344 TaxID=2692899 RepID=A0ABR8HL95_9CHRO|nr:MULTISPECIES: alpha-isopropylmalate synthase regulatory domain-containing protein [Microcystis]MCA2540679.1 hypothetical protein [Microcystis sp. M54BS1]MCA2595123.1 hypothetical protein [Microcystis sp. M38BS1]MCA2611293.1 hypothetical protein [Microcystis sp. M27BS1]MBD2620193.1 hypothetical protein [Microcystis flos-aquae FACHB-1344]MCA2505141.1 hypothetical protein [Microcystis sp. M62BS1]